MKKKDWEKELEEIVNNIDIKKTPSEGDWIDKEYKSATKNVLIEFIKQLLDEDDLKLIAERQARKIRELERELSKLTK